MECRKTQQAHRIEYATAIPLLFLRLQSLMFEPCPDRRQAIHRHRLTEQYRPKTKRCGLRLVLTRLQEDGIRFCTP